MQVQKEICQHHDDAVASVNRHRMSENAFPDLRIAEVFAQGHEGIVFC
jgi:hypothetical protein